MGEAFKAFVLSINLQHFQTHNVCNPLKQLLKRIYASRVACGQPVHTSENQILFQNENLKENVTCRRFSEVSWPHVDKSYHLLNVRLSVCMCVLWCCPCCLSTPAWYVASCSGICESSPAVAVVWQ